MNLLQGIDLSHGRENELTVPVVKHRILHVDADIVAYEIATQNGGYLKYKDIRESCECYIDAIKAAAGAEIVVCHTTPKGSTKGNRYNLAKLKVYQGNRVGKEKPPALEYTREYLVKPDHNKWFGIAHTEQEADDGLAQAMHQARMEGKSELAVLTSRDKDLRMIPGWHLDWETHELFEVSELGYLEDQGKKVYGCGLKWFFFQMLTGDQADNISGLPKVAIGSLEKFLGQEAKKPRLCGQKMALKLLDGCESLESLFLVVATCYSDYAKEVGFKSYTEKDINAKTAFLSEAYLLWMRQEEGDRDFNRFIKDNKLTNLFKEIFND